MTHHDTIWNTMKRFCPKGKKITLSEIYEIVESHIDLDAEDYYPQAPGSSVPKWKRNVRNVLQKRKKAGEIIWLLLRPQNRRQIRLDMVV